MDYNGSMKNDKPFILIVDGSKTVQMVIQSGYKDIYHVEACSKPSEARSLLVEQANDVDIILLDINMPELNGWEFCEELKSDDNTKKIPIIFISGHEKNEDIIRGIEIGGSDYITKPFDLNILKVRIDNLIRMKKLQEDEIELGNLKSFKTITVTLSHEINNGLMVALGALHKMRKENSDNEAMTQELDKLDVALIRIQKTIAGLREADINALTQYVGETQMFDLKTNKR